MMCFLSRLISALPNMNLQYLIVEGDLNFVLDQTLDRLSSKLVSPFKMAA